MLTLRPLLSVVPVTCAAYLAAGATAAWREARVHGWSELGLDWLTWQRWAQLRPWRESLAVGLAWGALVALVLFAARRERRAARALAPALGAASHPALVLLALAAALGLPAGWKHLRRPTAPAGAPNVLFVLVDTWRADHAGFLGYERDVSPNLDRLAARGVVFERAVAQSGWTKPSVATLFTGLLPSAHRAVSQPLAGLSVRGTNLPPRATTWIELLAASGWATGMWSNNPNILPARGFGQGAEHFVDFFHRRRPGFDAGRSERMLPEVEDWIAERGDTRPFCAYVHVMDPHYPYVAPPPFAGTFDRSGLDFQLVGPVVDEYLCGERDVADVTPEELARLVDVYDEELLYVDHHLGPFLERVLAAHPDTVVVLVGDHGEEFLEHGQLGHGHSLYEELVHVPLVLLAPELRPGRVAAQVRLMDVAPTLLELVGLEPSPARMQGESLVALIADGAGPGRAAPMESGGDQRPPWQWRGIAHEGWKLLRREADLPTARPVPPLSERDRTAPRPYALLFDLTRDPEEERDLSVERSDQVERLFQLFEERDWYRSPSDVLRLPAVEVDLEGDVEALRNLGYAGG